MSVNATTRAGQWTSPTALPITNGRLATALFLSTEVMFFAALFSAYLVFRMGANDWPTSADMRVHRWVGILNTLVLLASSVTLVFAWRACRWGTVRAARGWLMATLILGAVFLSIKGGEFYDKWRFGLFNWGGPTLLHERADLHYLAHLKSAVLQWHLTGDNDRGGDSADRRADAERDWRQLMAGGLIDWTSHMVRWHEDAAIRVRALANTAALVYPHRSLNPASLANELAVLRIELQDETRQQATWENELQTLQKAVASLSTQGGESPLDAARQAQLNEMAVRVSELSQELTRHKAKLDPLRDRVALLERTENHWDRGLSRSRGDRLPMVIPHGQTWASLYLLLAGCHALHVCGGLVAMICCWPRQDRDFAQASLGNIRLYWYFVDVVWIALLLLIYF